MRVATRFPLIDIVTLNDVVTDFEKAVAKVMNSQETKEFATRTGRQLMPLASAAMQKYQLREVSLYRDLVKQARLK